MNKLNKIILMLILSTNVTTPVLADENHTYTKEDLQYMYESATGKKLAETSNVTGSTILKYTDNTNTTLNDDNTINNSTAKNEKTRVATTKELNGNWVTRFDGRENVWTYHLSDGSHYEGWLNDNGNFYYIKWDKMLTDTYAEGCYLGSNGILTTPPATSSYSNRTITPQDVNATKELREKLLNEGWAEDTIGNYWGGDEANIYWPAGKDGISYNTNCHIVSGVGTVPIYTESGFKDFNNYRQWTNNDSHLITLPLDKYLEYKKDGKILKFTVNSTADGIHYLSTYSEYLKDGTVLG